MSGTIAWKVAAGVACALALGGCGSDDDEEPDASGASGGGASGFTSEGVTFSGGGGDQVTFSSGADQVTFAGGADQVTFSSGNPSGVTFSSPGAATFSSPPAPVAPVAPVVPGAPIAPSTDASGTPIGGSAIDPADVGAADELGGGEAPGIDGSAPVGEASDVATRGEDPVFGFWSADDLVTPAAPAVPDERVFRIALRGEEIRVEWFVDETREGGSGQNCWTPDGRAPVTLVDGDGAFVAVAPSGDGTRVEYGVGADGRLRVETYSDAGLEATAVHAPALDGLAFADFPLCAET